MSETEIDKKTYVRLEAAKMAFAYAEALGLDPVDFAERIAAFILGEGNGGIGTEKSRTRAT